MVSNNISLIKEKIQKAAQPPIDVTLVCVTKTASIRQVQEAIAAGISDIGENRVNDALLKYNAVGSIASSVRWHMIGHLQTNKVKKALEIFDVIHSLDSLKLAKELDKQARFVGKRVDCFVEVNVSGEPSKYGIQPQEAEEFIRKVSPLSNIRIIGFMTMAPFSDDPESSRPYFIKLRKLRDSLRSKNIPNTDIRELSMGMSQDFEAAVEEGATFVRVGTAIFSPATKPL